MTADRQAARDALIDIVAEVIDECWGTINTSPKDDAVKVLDALLSHPVEVMEALGAKEWTSRTVRVNFPGDPGKFTTTPVFPENFNGRVFVLPAEEPTP